MSIGRLNGVGSTLQKCFEDFKNLKIKRTGASLITDTPLVSINGVSILKMTKW